MEEILEEEGDGVGWMGKAWIGAIFGYSILRALVVWPTLGDNGVNPWIFLIIDVATAWPYAYGQVKLVKAAKARDWRQVQIWSVVAAAAFLAPYAYIVVAGSGQLSTLAWIIIGVLVLAFGTASILRVLRQIRSPET